MFKGVLPVRGVPGLCQAYERILSQRDAAPALLLSDVSVLHSTALGC